MNMSLLSRLGCVPLGLAAWMGLTASAAAAAPPNDNFANATVITGFWGTTNADTSAATRETGEPAHAGLSATHSVWYQFVAVQDGNVTIHTYGSAIDTRLAAYSVPANTNAAVTSALFPLAANDDMDLSAVYGPTVPGGPSIITFPVKQGAAYYVAVDSNGGGGQIQLTWGYNFGGLFYFPKPQVEAGKSEGYIQFAVGRAFGYSGRVLVDVVTTNNYTGPNTPATEGVDYLPVATTITFDDFEMLKTFIVPILDAPFAGDPEDTNSAPVNPNYYFGVQIVRVRFDPQENTNLLAPGAILTGQDTSVGRMLELNVRYGFGDPGPTVPLFAAATNVINFWVRHHTVAYGEPYADRHNHDGYAHVFFTRNGFGDPNQSCTIHWGVDSSSRRLSDLGNLLNNYFDLSPESDYATPDPPESTPRGVGPWDFGGPYTGTVTWDAGDYNPKEILFPINNDQLVEFNEDFEVELSNEGAQTCMMGELNTCVTTIPFDGNDQPAGALEGGFNGHIEPPYNPIPGANAVIFATAIQPDGKAVIGGGFTAYNAYLRNRIARVNVDGTMDSTFDPGNGADGLVTSLALQTDGNILMGGDFRSVNGVNRYRVARLTPSGGVDPSFNPGAGVDDTVWSLALSTSNSVIIGGQFGNCNNYPRDHVARLDPQGNVDLTFDTSNLGLNGTVWAVAPQSDGKVVIGGEFTTVGGVLRSRVARLNADGSLDTTFDPGLGANDAIYTVLVQPDGRILVGGAFTQFHTAIHHGLTRLASSGALDPSFSPGSSANDAVYSVLFGGGMIYVGGTFTEFNGTRRVGLARLFNDGTVDTGFLDMAYNHFAGLINPLFNPDLYPRNVVYSIGLNEVIVNGTSVQDVLIGGSFDHVGGGGGSRRSWDRRLNLALLRGGSTIGPGNLTITYPSGNGFNNANKNQSYLPVVVTRANGTLGTVGTRFSPDPQPVGPGAAIYGQDYTYDPINSGQAAFSDTWAVTRMVSDGIWNTNYPVSYTVFPDLFVLGIPMPQVDIINNTTASGNRSYNLNLSIPAQADTFFLGGANVPLGTALGPQPSTPSLIIDNRNRPGTFTFITTNYTVSESAVTASIMVIRTNGSDDTVRVKYVTQDISGTPPPGVGFARSNVNYQAASGTLRFDPTITNLSFNVTILQDGHVDPDLALRVVITNIVADHPLNGTPQAGITNAWLTIIDGDFPQGRLNFSTASFATNEDAGNAVITVKRTGGSQGALSVLCSTTATNTTATNGVNYLAVTNILLSWTNGESSPKTFMVPVLHDFQIAPNLTVGLQLSAPVLNGLTNYAAMGPLSNAILTILNVDNLGFLSFSSPTYSQNESGGYAIIPVVRKGGSIGTLTATFMTSAGTNTTAGIDFVPTNAPLSFEQGEISKVFTVPLIDNQHVDVSNRTVVLQLTNPSPPGILASPSTAVLNIFSDGYNLPPGGADPNFHPAFNGVVNAVGLQPNGAIVAGGAFTVANSVTRNRLARLNANGSLDFSFASQPGGANDTVRALALQTDGRILIVGDFLTYDGVNRSYFARVNLDGTLDWQFDPGSGLDHSGYAVVETFTDTNRTVRKILVGGSFTLANGAARHYLAQFNDNGSVDLDFNADSGAGGIDGPVWAIAVQEDHKIIIGGDFLTINGVACRHIARLNANGSLDTSFNNPGTGANDSVRALAIQLDKRILVGGLFTTFNRTVQNRILRLNADGSLDAGFNGGVGANGAVYTIALQPDNRILLGGEFTACSGVTRGHLTRLNPDGSVDPAINFGAGCNNYVASLVVQPDDAILLGGGFTTYDNAKAPYMARVFGRAIAGSGTFEFTSATFGADETATNAVVTVRRRGGTAGTPSGPNVYVTVAATDGFPPNGATNGVNYVGGLFTNTFPPGETLGTVLIPMLRDFQVTSNLEANLQLTDIQPLGPAGLGNQPIATLFVTNVDSAVHFSSATYSIAKNAQEGRATIPVYRFGSTVGSAQVDFMTTGGTAQPYGRYIPVITNVFFGPGQTTQNVFIPIINDNLVQGDQTVTMVLANPLDTLLSTPVAATLTILETSTASGTLAFSAPSYTVSESGGNAYLDVLRTNGTTGTVTADYFTRNGTAAANLKYIATNGALIFADGETRKTIVVPIINEADVEGNKVFSVVLTNATGGATFTGPTTVPVTIVDDDVGISFTDPIAEVPENAGTKSLSVFRQNGTNLTTTVRYATTNLTAVAGTNYVAVTNGLLTFNPGETTKAIIVQVKDDPRVTGPLQFTVNLFNPTNVSDPTVPIRLFNYGSVVVNVLDTDTGFTFGTADRIVIPSLDETNASYGVLKSGTNLLVTVVRSNASTGTVSLNYATATNANDTAVAGVDYAFTSGLLTFSNNVPLQSFVVPIFNNRQPQGDRTFSINLFNPSGGAQLIPPSTATVTITDDVAAVSFSSADYRANENAGSAAIAVLRSNYTNSIVKVDFGTASLTAVPGVNYSNVSGTLTFNPGETVKTFAVPVKDDGVLHGDTTVSVALSNLVGNAVFINPSAATLTVLEADGSLIVNAGAALITEGLNQTNGVIDPGETVTVRFALRNMLGTNTLNLAAELLTTNGITNPKANSGDTPAVASYGMLVTHGPSFWQPFTFTAAGTNGQTIGATFELRDGETDLGQVVFNFGLGQAAARFANPAAIVINDNTTATPYPSTINVAGVAGVVTKATATLSNLNHTWPGDIDALLVSPTGQKSYLMAKCGGGYRVDNVTLTFDDAAATKLTNSLGQIVSGTNRPTSYQTDAQPFPQALTPLAPYRTNMSAFNGNDPNGDWSLYVIDDSQNNEGVISNGWSLSLVTSGVVSPAADVGLAMITSELTNTVTTNLTFTLSLTNFGPWHATNIVVTNPLPAGMDYVGNSRSSGTVSTNARMFTWTVPWLGTNAADAWATSTLTVRFTNTGVFTNTAGLTTKTLDLNPDNDTASAKVYVVAPTADLVLMLADSPNPVLLGNDLVYTITISNASRATASGVVASNTLPSTVAFVSASPANYAASYNAAGQVVVTFGNLGNLGSGATTNLSITTQPLAVGTITDTAACRSEVIDPLKANNAASVKTVVQPAPLPLTLAPVKGGVAISWPAYAGYFLESTADLRPPAVWVPVTDAQVSLVGGQLSVVVPIGAGNRFFRLNWASTPTPLPLSISDAGTSVTIAWPVNLWNFKLESADTLSPPVMWTPVSPVTPVIADGLETVTLPAASAGRFFRLHANP